MKLLWYKCATCGNKCLSDVEPDNSVCGGCDNPNWCLMIQQTAYKVGDKDSININGKI